MRRGIFFNDDENRYALRLIPLTDARSTLSGRPPIRLTMPPMGATLPLVSGMAQGLRIYLSGWRAAR